MRDFNGKVAVVTGAASGMGRAFCYRVAREGMKIVIGDVEKGALDKTIDEMRSQGIDAIGVVTDVSKEESVQNLAQQALNAFGSIHIAYNNAGVWSRNDMAGLAIWEEPLSEWNWLMGVNFYGVLYGVRTFLPIILKQGGGGHLINTSSTSGLNLGNSIYAVTKHAVTVLSEAVYAHLRQRNAPVGVSVLCPAAVDTGLFTAGRNRPGDSPLPVEQDPGAAIGSRPRATPMARAEDVAEAVFQAVYTGQFYIIPHHDSDETIRDRVENILARRNPAVPMATR